MAVATRYWPFLICVHPCRSVVVLQNLTGWVPANLWRVLYTERISADWKVQAGDLGVSPSGLAAGSTGFTGSAGAEAEAGDGG